MGCLKREYLPNLFLFLITVGSTMFVGSFQSGGNPLKDPGSLRLGFPFSFTLLSILLFHELSHFFSARLHRAITSLPYFIPAPTLLGTFGAIIKMRSPLPNRKALLDVGFSGPLASFILSVIAVSVGLFTSTVVSEAPEGSMNLGSSIIFSFLTRVIKGSFAEGGNIMLNPIAFAGWIGFLVTAINLLPVGQLDGGHISYSFSSKWYPVVARGVFLVLIALGIIWRGWMIWAMLVLFLGFKHPPPLDDATPLDKKRKILGVVGYFILIVTFVPKPFS